MEEFRMHSPFKEIKHSRQASKRTRRRRAAARRALTAARLCATGQAPNPTAAAECCGSNPGYVRHAVKVLQAEDAALIEQVRDGQVPLADAAVLVETRAALISAW